MKKFLLGLCLGVSLPLLAGYLFFTTGGMPVATANPPLPLERYFAHKALESAMKGEVNMSAPMPEDEPNLLAGAKAYRAQCAVCHGLRTGPGPAFAKKMFPPAPQLLAANEGVTDDPVGETHWKVKNGIRLTGMPAFEGVLCESEMWQVSLLLHQADKLPAPIQAALQPAPAK